MPYELPGILRPEGFVKTTASEIKTAGRDRENLERLKEKSLGYEQVGPGVWALVLPKMNLYVPGAGLDHMIMVAKEQGLVGNVAQLSPRELRHLIDMTQRLHRVYEEEAGKTGDPVALEVTALNFHEDPVVEETFGQKLYAQTIKDLHIHVLAFRTSDTERPERNMGRKEITRTEWRDVHDPFLRLADILSRNALIEKTLVQGLRSLSITRRPATDGFTFVIPAVMKTSEEFASDLANLHHNFLSIYKEIAGLFVDTLERDRTGMPPLRPFSERGQRIEDFVSRLEPYFPKEQDAKLLATWLRRVHRLLKSGEEMERVKQRSPNAELPIFLRGGAYTLSLIQKTGEGNTLVHLAPRILSTGNALSSLGLHKTKDKGSPTDQWMKEREKVEQAIKAAFSPGEHQWKEVA